jgi:molybdopterin-guanine dinucleotide biosynthesis protein A
MLISAPNDIRFRPYGYPVFHDDQAGLGLWGDIAKALSLCDSPLLIVLAVDMPAMTGEFLNLMLLGCDPATGMVPCLGPE